MGETNHWEAALLLMDKGRGETRSLSGIVVTATTLLPVSNPFYLLWLRRSLGKDLLRKNQEQLLIPMSRTGHSHHSWRIPCLRTRVGEQWDHFFLFSIFIIWAFFLWVGKGCFESLGEDGEDSSGWCTFYNRYLTPGKLGKASLRRLSLRTEGWMRWC